MVTQYLDTSIGINMIISTINLTMLLWDISGSLWLWWNHQQDHDSNPQEAWYCFRSRQVTSLRLQSPCSLGSLAWRFEVRIWKRWEHLQETLVSAGSTPEGSQRYINIESSCESSLQKFLFIPDCKRQKWAEVPRIRFFSNKHQNTCVNLITVPLLHPSSIINLWPVPLSPLS